MPPASPISAVCAVRWLFSSAIVDTTSGGGGGSEGGEGGTGGDGGGEGGSDGGVGEGGSEGGGEGGVGGGDVTTNVSTFEDPELTVKGPWWPALHSAPDQPSPYESCMSSV